MLNSRPYTHGDLDGELSLTMITLWTSYLESWHWYPKSVVTRVTQDISYLAHWCHEAPEPAVLSRPLSQQLAGMWGASQKNAPTQRKQLQLQRFNNSICFYLFLGLDIKLKDYVFMNHMTLFTSSDNSGLEEEFQFLLIRIFNFYFLLKWRLNCFSNYVIFALQK